MLDLLNYLLDSVTYFFDFTYTFLTSGIYNFFVWAFQKFVEYSTKAAIEFALFSIPFAWDVAKNIIVDLGISAQLSNAWSALDSNTLGIVTYLRLPDSLNVIISAFMTRFVLRFIPFV